MRYTWTAMTNSIADHMACVWADKKGLSAALFAPVEGDQFCSSLAAGNLPNVNGAARVVPSRRA